MNPSPNTSGSAARGGRSALRPRATGWLLVAGLLGGCVSAGAAGASRDAGRDATAAAASIRVIASGLNEPKKLTLAADGDLIVALSGDGRASKLCTDGDQRACLDRSGAIDELTPSGHVTRLLSGLVSDSSGADRQATGPVQARLAGGSVQVLFQDLDLNLKTGVSELGPEASLLGDLVRYGGGRERTIEAELGRYEAEHEPDHGAGTAVAYGWEAAINSDPYSFVPYHGGYAVADAGANDVLSISRTGKVSVLAVLPTIRERAAAGSFGSSQKRAIVAQAQPVPTAIAVGPDGALYVGELGGEPFDVGSSDVYRIVPGRKPTVYARGLTAIGDITFDSRGRLLVLEIDRKGLNDPGLDRGHPASGEIVEIGRDGSRTVASTGLDFPTGLVAGRDGYVYVSDDGVTPAGDGHGGEIVALKLS